MSDNRKKFLFDLHDFEKEAEEEKEKRKNKAPPAPSFSLEDMEQARKDSFAKGKAEGMQLAKDSIEQQTELLVQSLADDVKRLETAESQRQQDYLDHSIAISYRALEKILGPLLNETQEDQIKTALQGFFSDTAIKTDMTLYVHSSMIKAIEPYAQSLGNKLHLAADDKLSPVQARVEWDTGAFEFKPDVLMEQILQTIKAHVPDALDEGEKNPHNEEIGEHDHKEEQDS